MPIRVKVRKGGRVTRSSDLRNLENLGILCVVPSSIIVPVQAVLLCATLRPAHFASTSFADNPI
jgi:hypothetical protein